MGLDAVGTGPVGHPRPGGSWTGVRGLPTNAKVVADRVRAGTFYALAGGTLYVSTDAAASFTSRAGGLAQGNLEAVFGREGDLWIAAGGLWLFHSTDGGSSFSRVGAGVGTAHRIGFGRAAPGQSHPAAYVTGRVNNVWGVFRSDDGGGSWTRSTTTSTSSAR